MLSYEIPPVIVAGVTPPSPSPSPTVIFGGAEFSGGAVVFCGARFLGGCMIFVRMLGHLISILLNTYAYFIPTMQGQAAQLMDDILTPIPFNLGSSVS